ncbi:hypothetical protein JW905_01040 [bacterium]|nr:hypothetical protein [candidate division CSSED10-310 bacterium]
MDGLLSKARRHQIILNASMVLGTVAFIGFLAAVCLKFGGGSWKLIILWLAATLFMLNSFGMNNAVSLSLLYRVYRDDPAALRQGERRELEEEIAKDETTVRAEPASKTAVAVFAAALLLMGVGTFRILSFLGVF